jgi:nitrogen regulatory protein PII
MTIVNKGAGRKIVKATKAAGAEGGTTMLARGTARRQIKRFLGIVMEQEKELIFTLVPKAQLPEVIDAVVGAGKLEKIGDGIAFTLHVKQFAGICHVCNLSEPLDKREEMDQMSDSISYDLIITIVNRDNAELVVEASKNAGAEGGTILSGRGTGIHEQAKLFGISIEPEKEIVLTLIKRDQTATVLEAIIRETQLDKPGQGIAFVLEVEQVAGINHLFNEELRAKMDESGS